MIILSKNGLLWKAVFTNTITHITVNLGSRSCSSQLLKIAVFMLHSNNTIVTRWSLIRAPITFVLFEGVPFRYPHKAPLVDYIHEICTYFLQIHCRLPLILLYHLWCTDRSILDRCCVAFGFRLLLGVSRLFICYLQSF